MKFIAGWIFGTGTGLVFGWVIGASYQDRLWRAALNVWVSRKRRGAA